jgi:hypothetical protein
MGAAQSTAKKEYGDDLEGIDLIDLIATKYILTQNFQDMKRLTQKEYCDKLVVLTSDIIKKYMNKKDVKYLAERIKDGRYANELVEKKLMVINTGEIKHKNSKADQPTDSNNNSTMDTLKLIFEKTKTPQKRKTVISNLDVKDKEEKDRMCKGIAKFYISIAHLYAAIVKTLNPMYTYEDKNGKTHAMSIQNRDKIPRNVTPIVKEVNLCSKRINALKPIEMAESIKINIGRACAMNSERQNITVDGEWKPSMLKDTIKTKTRVLGQEVGIPELQQLYWNKYDYLKGKYMEGVLLKESEAEKDYDRDLKTFYTTFTGKNDYNSWNKEKNKRFSDIPLIAYHESPLCKGIDSEWRQTYDGSGGLFATYANKIKSMMQSAEKTQTDLTNILKEIFKVQVDNNKTEMVIINPELTEDSLAKIIDKTRKMIVKLYLTCEKDFKEALDIFEGIVGERMIKNTVEKRSMVMELQDTLISRPTDKKTTNKIKSVLTSLII